MNTESWIAPSPQDASGLYPFHSHPFQSHRVVLTLEYSHDAALAEPATRTALRPPAGAAGGCVDAMGTVGADYRGRAFTCATLAEVPIYIEICI